MFPVTDPMRRDLWKRLDSVVNDFGVGNQLITVIQYATETDADVDQKLARWRSGEVVEDVVTRPSSEELVVVLRRFGR